MMTDRLYRLVLAASLATAVSAPLSAAPDQACFESREGAAEVTPKWLDSGEMSVRCSPDTGGVLWWGDPFEGTIPMGDMAVEADYSHEEAVIKSREPYLDRNKMLTICATACHEGNYVPYPTDKSPRPLKMHQDVVPDPMKLQHGRGGIWCLDCHHPTQRDKLYDNFGGAVSFNQPQKVCGKCHGREYRDWRDGIHGKRIGMWDKGGKKRWWLCTECHDPHDVQQGERNSGFAQLAPEPPPRLPKGMENADHERMHHGPKRSDGGH